jgi:gentisate 1,2-dioxygenase
MRYRVETQEAAALVDGGGMGWPAVDTARPAGVIAAWMIALRAGDMESGRADADVDCLFYVVSGLARAVVGARECAAAAGDRFVALADEAYSVSNAGNSELRVLEMQLPCRSARLQGYADTCGDSGPARRNEE